MSGDDFLSRWSRRKHLARKGEPVEAAPPEPAKPVPRPVQEAAATGPEETPLPPVETLTPESDFTPFMQPKVDGQMRNRALKTLFQDPHFNVMDGLDVYIDDYSKPDPLPDGWLEKMNQVARLGAYEPPKEEDSTSQDEAEESAPPLAANGAPLPVEEAAHEESSRSPQASADAPHALPDDPGAAQRDHRES